MVALKQERVEPLRRVTAQEYLERERTAETKSEFHGGVIVAMAGASPEHNAIVFDLAVALGAQFAEGHARVSPTICACGFQIVISTTTLMSLWLVRNRTTRHWPECSRCSIQP